MKLLSESLGLCWMCQSPMFTFRLRCLVKTEPCLRDKNVAPCGLKPVIIIHAAIMSPPKYIRQNQAAHKQAFSETVFNSDPKQLFWLQIYLSTYVLEYMRLWALPKHWWVDKTLNRSTDRGLKKLLVCFISSRVPVLYLTDSTDVEECITTFSVSSAICISLNIKMNIMILDSDQL